MKIHSTHWDRGICQNYIFRIMQIQQFLQWVYKLCNIWLNGLFFGQDDEFNCGSSIHSLPLCLFTTGWLAGCLVYSNSFSPAVTVPSCSTLISSEGFSIPADGHIKQQWECFCLLLNLILRISMVSDADLFIIPSFFIHSVALSFHHTIIIEQGQRVKSFKWRWQFVLLLMPCGRKIFNMVICQIFNFL